MKKFLTMLLALSVVFTYTVGTAFATTEYSLDDYAKVLTAEKTAQLSYLAVAKERAVGTKTFDKDGFSPEGYMKAAYEAAANAVIADLSAKMDAKINDVLNGKFPTTTAPNKTVISEICKGADTFEEMLTELAKAKDGDDLVLDKAQAPLTKAFVEAKLNVDLSKYNATDKKYEANTLTAVQYIGKLVDIAKEDIKAADEQATAALKKASYDQALTKFNAEFAKVATLADEDFQNQLGQGTVEAKVEKWAQETTAQIIADLNIDANMPSDATLVWTGKLANFWEADKIVATKGTLFGVNVANIGKVTRSEAVAVLNAAKKAVSDAKVAVVAYGKTAGAVVPETPNYSLLANAMKVTEKCNEIKALGEKYKAAEYFGIKKYDDASVDKAVKAAEKLVYADLKSALMEASEYIENAAKNEGITLENQSFELSKFEKAIQDAAKKMYSDGTGGKTPTVKVSYGDNKTSDADLVYLREVYDNKTEWDKIATQAVADLINAQSYDDIKAVMEKAAKDFGKLLKAADKADVDAAVVNYSGALVAYGNAKKSLLGANAEKYVVDKAVAQAKAELAKATTVEAVKAAYEEGKKLIDNVKTKDELNAAKVAVEKQIAALPYTSLLTLADKPAVKAAYDAFNNYNKMAGADVSPQLKEKYNKIIELEAKAIEEKAKALNDKLKTMTDYDADVAAKVALKADADALKVAAKALKDEVEAVNKDNAGLLDAITLTEFDKLNAVDFSATMAKDAEIKLVKAAKENATVEEMKDALKAYGNLTDRQKYTLDKEKD
ncbi:MAG: hypothetical protein PHH48_06845, partial [Eubacteriales bacterium]|nr:hypothetical protein [Eubacteriales bacterium]